MSHGEQQQAIIDMLVTDDCPPCREGASTWRELCRELGLPFRCHDATSRAALELTGGTVLATLPAVFIKGRLVAVGVQTRAQAVALLIATGCLEGHPPAT